MDQRKNIIGELGEVELKKWATQLGCTVNPAIKDEKGWDFLIEFAPNFSPDGKAIPLDKVDSPLKCWIQVKSTDGKSGKQVSVNLKNWLHLVYTPYPAFFLVVDFNGMDEPQKAFLVHIDETYISKVLKRLRKAGATNQNRLHKIWIKFSYCANNELPSLNGTGLLLSIQKYVQSTNQYMDWKQKFVEEVGYEQGQKLIQVTFGHEVDPLDHLIDLTLGIIPKIETTNVEIKDVRFGIEAPELTQKFNDPGFLSVISEPVEEGDAVFWLADFSREVTIHTDVFIPVGIRFDLDKRYWKVRFSSPFYEFVFNPTTGEGKSKFIWPKVNEKYLLADLHNIAQFILLLSDARLKGVEIQSEFRVKGDQIKGKQVINDAQIPQEVVDVASKIEYMWTIVKYFNIQKNVKLSIAELLRLQFLDPVYILLFNQGINFRAKYWLEKKDPHSSKVKYVPCLLPLITEQYAILIAFVIVGNPQKTGNTEEDFVEWKIISNEILLRKEMCRKNPGVKDIRQWARDLLNLVIEPLDDANSMLITNDVKELLDE